jgi:bifunctional non-homologous end joining protein LigD
MVSVPWPTSRTEPARLISRKQIQYKSFAGLSSAMAKLPIKNAILDGELVCLDQDGRSQFMELMRRRHDACFYAFDLLWLNGVDLRPLPLLDRKAELRKLVHEKPGILYADYLKGAAVELFRICCAQDLEGIVIKAARGPYTEAPRSWLKVINPDYSQHRGRREMFGKFRERRTSTLGEAPRKL